MNNWERALHFRRVLRTAIVVALVLLFTYLADEDRDTEGWLFVAGLAIVGLVAAVLLVRRMR